MSHKIQAQLSARRAERERREALKIKKQEEAIEAQIELVNTTNAAYGVANIVVEKIIQNGGEFLFEHQVDKLIRPYLLKHLFDEQRILIEQVFIDRDNRADDIYLDGDTAEIEPSTYMFKDTNQQKSQEETKQRIIIPTVKKSGRISWMNKLKKQITLTKDNLEQNDLNVSMFSQKSRLGDDIYQMNLSGSIKSKKSNSRSNKSKQKSPAMLSSKEPKTTKAVSLIKESPKTQEEQFADEKLEILRRHVRQRDIHRQFEEEARQALLNAKMNNPNWDMQSKRKFDTNNPVTTDFKGKVIKIKHFRPQPEVDHTPKFEMYGPGEKRARGQFKVEGNSANPDDYTPRVIPVRNGENFREDPRQLQMSKNQIASQKQQQQIQKIIGFMKGDNAMKSQIEVNISSSFKPKGKKLALKDEQTVETELSVDMKNKLVEGVKLRTYNEARQAEHDKLLQQESVSMYDENVQIFEGGKGVQNKSTPMLQLFQYHKGKRGVNQSMDFAYGQNMDRERRRFDCDASEIMHAGDGDNFSMCEYDSSPVREVNKSHQRKKQYQQKLGKIKIGHVESTVDMLSESRDFMEQKRMSVQLSRNEGIFNSEASEPDTGVLGKRNNSISYSLLPVLKGIAPQSSKTSLANILDKKFTGSRTSKLTGLARVRSDLQKSQILTSKLQADFEQNKEQDIYGTKLTGLNSQKNMTGLKFLKHQDSTNLFDAKKAFYKNPLNVLSNDRYGQKQQQSHANLLKGGPSNYNSVPLSISQNDISIQKSIPSKVAKDKNLKHLSNMKQLHSSNFK